jgi:hypothetical protein
MSARTTKYGKLPAGDSCHGPGALGGRHSEARLVKSSELSLTVAPYDQMVSNLQTEKDS